MARRAQVRARPHNRKYLGKGAEEKPSGDAGGGGGAFVEIDWGTFEVVLPSGKPGAIVVVKQINAKSFEEHWFLSMGADGTFDAWIRPGAGNPRVDVTFRYRSADVSIPPVAIKAPTKFQQWRHVTNLVKTG